MAGRPVSFYQLLALRGLIAGDAEIGERFPSFRRATGAAFSSLRQVIFCVRGVISPLLANLYMNRFLKFWRITGRSEVFQAQVVNYADDFVILSRGEVCRGACGYLKA